jgi:hypothetical protein
MTKLALSWKFLSKNVAITTENLFTTYSNKKYDVILQPKDTKFDLLLKTHKNKSLTYKLRYKNKYLDNNFTIQMLFPEYFNIQTRKPFHIELPLENEVSLHDKHPDIQPQYYMLTLDFIGSNET